MVARPRLVLLDAGAVIHAHRVGGWKPLCAAYDVIVPGIVVGEATFFVDVNGNRTPIDLSVDFAAGVAKRYDALVPDFAATTAALPHQLRVRVHDGELEALTFLRTQGTRDTVFLSADSGAIEATVVLGFSNVAQSLEKALQACGITKALPYEHTEAFIREAKGRGGVMLAQFGMTAPAVPKKADG